MIANSVPTAKVDIDIDCLGGITMFKNHPHRLNVSEYFDPTFVMALC